MAKSMRPKVVLFFLNGAQPSEKELEQAAEFPAEEGYRVMFRNAAYIDESGNLEKFDLVAGAVPDSYARAAEAQGEPVEVNAAEEEAKRAEAAEKTRQAAAEAKEAAKAAKAKKTAEKAPGAAPDPKKPGNAWGGNASGWKPNA